MRYVILGKGGHAQALCDMLGDLPCFDDDGEVLSDDVVIIGVGDIATRRHLYEKFDTQVGAVCPKGMFAVAGHQMMPRAFVAGSSVIGVNVLVNTGAQIDHDCVIGDHCVISPGAVLCGEVTLGEACFVGASATILEGGTLEPGTFVPAGTLVVGQDHFRKPVRMVRRDRADTAYAVETLYSVAGEDAHVGPVAHSYHHRVDSDPQPRRAADGPSAAKRARPDSP